MAASVEEIAKRQRLIWYIGGIVWAIVMIIMIIIKFSSTTYSITSFILSAIVVSIIYAGVGLGYWYMNREKEESIKKETQPKACTHQWAYEEAMKALRSKEYANYIENPEFNGTVVVGDAIKSEIYTIIGTLKYPPKEKVAILINKHYPFTKRTILRGPYANEVEIKRYQRLLADSPETPADVEKTETTNPFTGTQQKTVKTVHKKPENKVENKDKGDLS